MKYRSYREYITVHKYNVIRAWETRLKQVLLEDTSIDRRLIDRIDHILVHHDSSKLVKEEEYRAYSTHFMRPESCPKDSEEYRRAWSHHQKNNPHHWQYWVVLEDVVDPKIYALEMDFEYVIEMLCDWQAASDHYGNTAHWWYETQKDNMILHPNTRALVEKYLVYMD